MHFHSLTKGGGRNKSVPHNRGRAPGETPAQVVRCALDEAPPSFSPPSSTSQPQYDSASAQSCGVDIFCSICTEVLSQPLQLACHRMVCAKCLIQTINISGRLACPCCYDHPLNSSYFEPPNAVTMAVLGSLHVRCNRDCNKTVRADCYNQHIASNCKDYYLCSTLSPTRATIRDILNKPLDAPPTLAEKRVAENVVKRMMTAHGTVKISTHGQVC